VRYAEPLRRRGRYGSHAGPRALGRLRLGAPETGIGRRRDVAAIVAGDSDDEPAARRLSTSAAVDLGGYARELARFLRRVEDPQFGEPRAELVEEADRGRVASLRALEAAALEALGDIAWTVGALCLRCCHGVRVRAHPESRPQCVRQH